MKIWLPILGLSLFLLGARTLLQTWQMVHDPSVPVLALPERTDVKTILSASEKEMQTPFKLRASLPIDSKLVIGPNQVEKGDGTTQTTAPQDDLINSFPLTTVDYQTGAVTGGTVHVENEAFALPECSLVGTFKRQFFVYVSSENKINSKFSEEKTLLSELQNAGTLASALDGTPVGYIDLECTDLVGKYKTAGSVDNVIETKVASESRIFHFGSGSGGGDGIKDFKLQSVADPSATIKKGFFRLTDGRTLSTFDGSGNLSTDFNVDLSINLDAVLGGVAQGGFPVNPENDKTYQLVIDLERCCNDDTKSITTTDTGRKLFPITEGVFDLLPKTNAEVDGERYVPIGEIHSADTNTQWSGVGSAFSSSPIRQHAQPLLVGQKVFTTGIQATSPTFPLPHSLTTLPTDCVLQHEGHVVEGKWTNISCENFCDFDEIEVSCDLSSLTIDATHRIRLSLGTGFNPAEVDSFDYLLANSNVSVFKNQKVITDSSSGSFTVTLPVSPEFGDAVEILDGSKTWGINSITITAGSGENIAGSSADLILDLSGRTVLLVYVNASVGWQSF